MTNSDYLIKATVKKISQKLNKTFFKKIEEAASIAQEAPETLKKELEDLKEDIITEAKRMEQIDNERTSSTNLDIQNNPKIEEALTKIQTINKRLGNLNELLEN